MSWKTQARQADLRRQHLDTAVQGGYIVVPALAEGGWRGVAAHIALLSLHDSHIRVQADDVPVPLQVPLRPHKQQATQDSCQGQVSP